MHGNMKNVPSTRGRYYISLLHVCSNDVRAVIRNGTHRFIDSGYKKDYTEFSRPWDSIRVKFPEWYQEEDCTQVPSDVTNLESSVRLIAIVSTNCMDGRERHKQVKMSAEKKGRTKRKKIYCIYDIVELMH